jgi:hypothetical protein
MLDSGEPGYKPPAAAELKLVLGFGRSLAFQTFGIGIFGVGTH